jgi:hypothetical protein
MSWALTEDLLNVAALSLLTIGTGAQAAGSLTDYKAILKTLPSEVRDNLLGPYAGAAAVDALGNVLFGRPPPSTLLKQKVSLAWFVTWTSPIALTMAVAAIPRKLIRLRREGGEVGRRAAGLARTSALWALLMVGSALALCAALIQLVHD